MIAKDKTGVFAWIDGKLYPVEIRSNARARVSDTEIGGTSFIRPEADLSFDIRINGVRQLTVEGSKLVDTCALTHPELDWVCSIESLNELTDLTTYEKDVLQQALNHRISSEGRRKPLTEVLFSANMDEIGELVSSLIDKSYMIVREKSGSHYIVSLTTKANSFVSVL